MAGPRALRPRFARATLSTGAMPAYSNAEADVLRHTFAPGNFLPLAALPDSAAAGRGRRGEGGGRLMPGAVSAKRQALRGENRRNAAATLRPKKTLAPNALLVGTFSQPEYSPSAYGLQADLRTKQRLHHAAIRMSIAGADFAVPSSRPHGKPKCVLALRAARSLTLAAQLSWFSTYSTATNSLYLCPPPLFSSCLLICHSTHPATHLPTRYADGFEDFTYRYPCSREPYEGTELQIERLRWLEASKVLHGPFVPGGADKPLSTGASRALLPQMMRELHALVGATWGDFRFSVLATADDHIVIRFDLAPLQVAGVRAGVAAFMETVVRTCFTVDAYRLTKVVEEWDRVVDGGSGGGGGGGPNGSAQGGHGQGQGQEGGFLHYTLRCPWSHSSKLETHFALHPEERRYDGPRAKDLPSDRPRAV
jgi:hypothetical protein